MRSFLIGLRIKTRMNCRSSALSIGHIIFRARTSRKRKFSRILSAWPSISNWKNCRWTLAPANLPSFPTWQSTYWTIPSSSSTTKIKPISFAGPTRMIGPGQSESNSRTMVITLNFQRWTGRSWRRVGRSTASNGATRSRGRRAPCLQWKKSSPASANTWTYWSIGKQENNQNKESLR